MTMEVPDDIDDAFALFKAKAEALDAALDATEAEQAAGRSGYASYLHAQKLSEDVNHFGRELARRIDEARSKLG